MAGLYSEVLDRLDKAKKNLIIEEWMMAASGADGDLRSNGTCLICSVNFCACFWEAKRC